MTGKKLPHIKICGLKDIATIEAMDGLPINEIGFVFAKSKRQVTPESAAALIESTNRLTARGGERPKSAGVFVNPTLEELDNVLSIARLDIVQLHGDESADLCRVIKERFRVQVWKALGMKPSSTDNISELSQTAIERITPYNGSVDAILIDSAGGGTGHTFDWVTIKEYLAAARLIELPLYIAGGLHADNVQELLNEYAPDGIDVSSGVETEGQKDIEKIRLFVRRVMES
ncbi:phosphoribosylanthranilate isomerase [Paenibacillus sp. 2TAB19]|uniref:phosphoribosylanthranilate isomerase n=1 Tax=Paenibacillus sp. 2TAB19 TaxID=3233003 RepID=UPI003F9DB2D7